MRFHEESSAPAGDELAVRDAAPARRAGIDSTTTGRPMNPAAAGLARCVAGSLAGRDTTALAAALADGVDDSAAYEASVRCTPHNGLRAGRMMIEQASREVLVAISAAIDVALPPRAWRWLDCAADEKLPLIVGWDMRGGGAQRCLKLYVNASDASQDTRSRVWAALAASADMPSAAPAVLGMNVLPDGGIEAKLYAQSDDAVALASAHAEPARRLATAARDEKADAGAVLSFDVEDTVLRPRAFFVALREPREMTAWRCVQTLPGYDAAAVDALFPFPPAPARSVGIALDGGGWTLYCKPRDSGRAPQSLEPAAIYRCAAGEVGVFIEPSEHAVRAFRRTRRHAISVRVREGAPEPRTLEALVDWFASQLDAAPETDFASPLWSEPPPPWQRITTALLGAHR